MPQTILQKLRIITLGNFHQLLDAVIDWNDLGSLEQYARDLGTAKVQMEQFDNGLQGSITTLQRDIANGQGLAVNQQDSVDVYLTDDDPSNDSKALPIQVSLDAVKANLAEDEAKLKEKLQQHEDASRAISQMQALLVKAERKIENLRDLEEETTTLEQGANAMDTMDEVMGAGKSIDDVGRKIQQQNATARAQFDRSLARASGSANDDTTISMAEASLIKRRQELAAQKAAG